MLPSIILAIAEKRSLDAVLNSIIQAIVQQPDVALARIWLKESGFSCPSCDLTSEVALHLRASGGTPLEAGVDWGYTTGRFHRVALDSKLKIAQIAVTGQGVRIEDLAVDSEWVGEPAWVRREKLTGFAAQPMMFHGEVLGVLAVFRRVAADDACWEWLRVLADAAAVAVANARAFEEAEALQKELRLERDYLREEVREVGSFGEILGQSAALQRVLRQVEMVASTEATVLILGESGTGKELIARAIHQRSARARKPLVKVNCGSIPHELFESEFFGHVRGAFTSAVTDRVGRFQLADGGTLFLDEAGEIPMDLQAKLLRVLQEGEFERVGENATRKVDVRVVAATNRDLKEEVAKGRFRLDLYYRLAVFPLEMPPLRDRKEDIAQLAAHFVRQAAARFHVAEPRLSHKELQHAMRYDWPGNIRELQNAVDRAVILAHDGRLELDLPDGQAPAPIPVVVEAGEVVPESRWREMERANIAAALKRANFRVSGSGGAAELLELHPATLSSRMKALGIRRQGV
ncbi:sigma 54-interacting transcriptional regulator [uncultured Paludibaculum sp.]|uniref:sigma-54-dependent Fis family transcriptional regulator n=1 Tax=uncultured Paludibaculum sp. TaxID=1765020 RepID=UPI002AAB5FB1|nr:sigma 54-interacting transcriptional regulator [uncultured Paludibaculum sp.]